MMEQDWWEVLLSFLSLPELGRLSQTCHGLASKMEEDEKNGCEGESEASVWAKVGRQMLERRYQLGRPVLASIPWRRVRGLPGLPMRERLRRLVQLTRRGSRPMANGETNDAPPPHHNEQQERAEPSLWAKLLAGTAGRAEMDDGREWRAGAS